MSEDRSNQGPQDPVNQLMGEMPQGRLGPQGIARDHLDSLAQYMPDKASGPTDLHRMHDYNKAVYNKLNESDRMLRHIREEMDKLTDMADTVTPQDVIGAAGRLVGHGVPAREMAVLLSDMPQAAGQGLASWLQVHDMLARQQEAEVDRVKAIAQHRMGVSAVRAMAADEMLSRGHRMRAQARSQAETAGPMAPPPRSAPAEMPQTSVMQVAQRPEIQGPGAEEAA